MADGIVLDKPGKPSYNSPSSFRAIVLLQTFSKILERIMNSRLSCVAPVARLLNPHQCGSLARLSASDATTTLTHEIRTLQMAGREVSILFLDIKRGFDNVNWATRCNMLKAKGVNPYLVSWSRSFLTGRSCWLLYQGSPKIFAPVSVGSLPGSPVSPRLFAIYVSRLHCEIPQGLTLSYVDDFGLTASSMPYRRNLQLLQRHYAVLKARGARLGVSFSIPKTEPIHWRTYRDRGPVSRSPIHLDGSIFPSKDEVRWLGSWFTPSISTTPHFTQRLAKAQAAFVAVKRLSPPGMGLPPFLCHRLASSLFFPILSYGADAFQPTVHMTRKLSAFWHKVQRWTTNCFTCTPTDILAVEACLPPIDLLLSYKYHLPCLRVMCSPPQIKPAAGRRSPPYRHHRCTATSPTSGSSPARMRGAVCPSHGSSRRRPQRIGLTFPWTPSPTQCSSYTARMATPPSQSPPSTYSTKPTPCPPGPHLPPAQAPVQEPSHERIGGGCAGPRQIEYRPSLKPHPFMGLSKFDAGRLHQMRSGKSYLCAHPSGTTTAQPPTPAAAKPLRVSSTPSSTVQPRGLPGPATFRGSLNSAPTPQRPRLVLCRPSGRAHLLHQVHGHSLCPGHVFSPIFLCSFSFLPLI